MDKIIWIAEFEYGEPRLAKAQLVKETEKQYKIKDGENIFNCYYTPSVINKSDHSKKLFFDVESALGYLDKKCQEYEEKLNKEIQAIHDWQVKMLSLLIEIKDVQNGN